MYHGTYPTLPRGGWNIHTHIPCKNIQFFRLTSWHFLLLSQAKVPWGGVFSQKFQPLWNTLVGKLGREGLILNVGWGLGGTPNHALYGLGQQITFSQIPTFLAFWSYKWGGSIRIVPITQQNIQLSSVCSGSPEAWVRFNEWNLDGSHFTRCNLHSQKLQKLS